MPNQNSPSDSTESKLQELLKLTRDLGAQELATALTETHTVIILRKDVRLSDILRQSMNLGLYPQAITYNGILPCIEITRRTPHD